MSSELERHEAGKSDARRLLILQAVEYRLKAAVERSGASYQGFAFKDRGYDCIMTLKGNLAGKAQIAFIGADGLGDCLVKAVKAGESDKLNWRTDRYST